MMLTAAPESTRQTYRIDRQIAYPYINTGYPDAADFEAIDVEAWDEMNKCMQGLKFGEEEMVVCLLLRMECSELLALFLISGRFNSTAMKKYRT